jgi:hypothetical protein
MMQSLSRVNGVGNATPLTVVRNQMTANSSTSSRGTRRTVSSLARSVCPKYNLKLT